MAAMAYKTMLYLNKWPKNSTTKNSCEKRRKKKQKNAITKLKKPDIFEKKSVGSF